MTKIIIIRRKFNKGKEKDREFAKRLFFTELGKSIRYVKYNTPIMEYVLRGENPPAEINDKDNLINKGVIKNG